MEPMALLRELACAYEEILGDGFAGFYVHGSLALGGFNPAVSDLDFIVTVRRAPSPAQKQRLIALLLEREKDFPAKGAEMSVVLREHCRRFCYPTPFELHYSIAHRDAARRDLAGYCTAMHGVDKDLAAHFSVLRAAGIALRGEPIAEAFGPVPLRDYLDSVREDVANAQRDILTDPVYIALNLCRVLALAREGAVLSKRDGGEWALRCLPAEHAPVVRAALRSLQSGRPPDLPEARALAFARYMLQQLELST